VPYLHRRGAKRAHVSSIGRLLFNRPVDRSRSISTVDKDSPTWEYGRYRRSIRIHLLENTVDIWSTVDFTQKSVEIDRRYGFISKKNRSTVDIDRPSGHGLKKIVNIDLTHPYFITNRYKWLTRTLTSFHGDKFFKRFSQNNTQERNKHTPIKCKMDTESRVFQGGVDSGKII